MLWNCWTKKCITSIQLSSQNSSGSVFRGWSGVVDVRRESVGEENWDTSMGVEHDH